MIGLVAALAYALTAFTALLVAAALSGSVTAAVCAGLSAGAAYAFQVLEDHRVGPELSVAQMTMWALSVVSYLGGVAAALFW